MFSLIITIISIALVAVLALATLYYGGDAFNKGSADAQAAKIVNQGQQLLGAAEMFFVDNKRWPNNVAELVSSNYLKSAPVAYQGNGTVAQAWAAAEWEMPTAGQPVFVADVDAVEACQAVNKRSIGLDGILTQAHTSVITQCYGTDTASLTAVVSKNSSSLLAVDAADPAALPASDIVTDTVPSASASSGWLPGYEPSAPTTGAVVDPLAPFLIKVTAQYSGGAMHLNLRALGGQDLSPYVAGVALFQASTSTAAGPRCGPVSNWTSTYGSPTALTWPAWPDLVTVNPATALGADPSTLDLTMYSYDNSNEQGDPSNSYDTLPLSLWDAAPCIESARVVVGELGGWFAYSDMANEGPESKSVCLAMTYNAGLGRHLNNEVVVPCP